MLDQLIRYYKEHGRSPGKRDIPDRDKFVYKYGSWNAALEAAGLPVNRKFVHTEEELIASLKRFFDENGRSPTANDCNKYDYLFDTKTYHSKLNCKTWSQVLRKAGLEEYYEISPFTTLPDEQILMLVHTLLNASGITTQAYYNKNKGNLPSMEFLKSRFESWSNILKLLNITPNQNIYTNEDLTDIFYEVKEYFGRVPSVIEFFEYSKITSDLYKYRFGSWRKFLKSIGEKPITKEFDHVTETNLELKEMYISFSLKNGYENGAPSRVLDLSEDIYSSDIFTVRFGSINKLRRACGFLVSTSYRLKYTDEAIKKMIVDLYHTLKRVPTRKDVIAAGLPATTISRYLQSTEFSKIFVDQVIIKTCKHCGIPKPIGEFIRHPQSFAGYTNQCRECNNSYLRKWEKKNRSDRYVKVDKTNKPIKQSNVNNKRGRPVKFRAETPDYGHVMANIYNKLGYLPTGKELQQINKEEYSGQIKINKCFKQYFLENLNSDTENLKVKCTKCEDVKNYSDFFSSKTAIYAIQNWCKACHHESVKNSANKSPERIEAKKEYQRQYQKNYKRKTRNH